MRNFPKDLIAEIKNKCPFLQRKPKTAEQRKEQIRIIQHEKRSAESEIDKEMRLKKQKEYDTGKRSAESERDKEMRLQKQKEYETEKRSAESETSWAKLYGPAPSLAYGKVHPPLHRNDA